MLVDIGMSEQERKLVVKQLDILLANEYVLYTKTLKSHWNVEGKHFGALHLFFKEQYEQLFVAADDVAERARSLGSMALGTLSEFLAMTTLAEHPGDNPDDMGMITLLLKDHEAIIKQLRLLINETLELNDAGTSNFLNDLMEKHEKMAWMLRAHLNK